MDRQYILEQFIWKIKEYAKGRANCVERGAETPEFAALLLQKYGYGIADAVFILRDNGIEIDRASIYQIVDEEVSIIDPNWKENMRKRWEAKPAAVVDISKKTT